MICYKEKAQEESGEALHMVISNEMLLEFRKDFDAAMEALRKKYDATITLGSITYSSEDERFSARLEVKNSRDSDLVARGDFDADVWKFTHLGFTKGMYGRIGIGIDGEQYSVIGFNTRAKKYPLKLIHIKDGQRVNAGEGFIKELLNEYYIDNVQVR